MDTTAEHRNGAVEREMGTRQRGLVDDCLEEGQFQSAIDLLKQLRSSNYKPSISHLHQLIYLSLQPLPTSAADKFSETSNSEIPSSPSKSTKKHLPSAVAIQSAQRLLMSFAVTNSPSTLAQALPSYEKDGSGIVDYGDSVIGAEAACIPNARHCWDILMEGFTQRQRRMLPTPKGKGKNRTHTFEEPFQTEGRAVVGENSWSVLDWLLLVFEQDELQTEARGLGQYSPQLLRQIPSPRNGTGARWDTEAPLRIIFNCLEQAEVRHRQMGARLMTLLINLSSTVHLDLPMFVASVFIRLSASGAEQLSALFSVVPPSLAFHRFKVSLCPRFLVDTANGGQSRVDDRPKVQARAQPRVFRSARDPAATGDMTIMSTSDSSGPLSHYSKHPLPEYNEIQHLMEMQISASSTNFVTPPLLLKIKFELFNSYAALQSGIPRIDRDSDWVDCLQDGSLSKTLDLAFDNQSGKKYRESLESIIGTYFEIQ